MVSILIVIAIAFIHTLAIMGYLSILACLTFSSSQVIRSKWFKASLRALLYMAGIGTIFLVPAYLYGQFKALITNEMFMAFAAAEIVAVTVLIISVKTWSRLLSNNLTKKKE
jgi:hypothetical protein